jgi:signal peptidase I|tara:strand:+ start:250292 stop:250843 length:552 start_codon:yes stop_codon:yes gene_type:complete
MKFFGGAVREILTFIVLAVIIVVPIRYFIAQPFVVEGESMHPTFESGDYLIVDQVSYRLGEPKRGDVVVFRYPADPSVFYIKRVIGLPGETVHINRGITSISKVDGETLVLDESYVVAEDATYSLDTALGTDQYFVMGDNRPRSSDSRVWGALPKEDMIGRAYIRLLPLKELGMLPGAIDSPL